VEQYNAREFSDYADVLWAFIGVIRRPKDRFPAGYLWGLPRDHLDEALLWVTCCSGNCISRHILPSHDGTFCRLPILPWIWIAKGHAIHYGKCPGPAIVSRVKWHEPIRYSDGYDMATHDGDLEEAVQSSMFMGEQALEIDPGLFDFALLHFTAHTAMLG
jgi:hypothetical protein